MGEGMGLSPEDMGLSDAQPDQAEATATPVEAPAEAQSTAARFSTAINTLRWNVNPDVPEVVEAYRTITTIMQNPAQLKEVAHLIREWRDLEESIKQRHKETHNQIVRKARE